MREQEEGKMGFDAGWDKGFEDGFKKAYRAKRLTNLANRTNGRYMSTENKLQRGGFAKDEQVELIKLMERYKPQVREK